MAAKNHVRVVPFNNRGLNVDVDIAQLQDGVYSELTNLVSVQEGALTIRNGNQRITGTLSFATHISVIHSIAKLRISSDETVNQYYIGEGDNIWRAPGPLPPPGVFMMFTLVTPQGGAALVTSPYPLQRFTPVRYYAGSIGTPWEFFACPTAMLKDNGSLAALQLWGIFPPTRPVVAVLDAVKVLPTSFSSTSYPYGMDVTFVVGGATNNRLVAMNVTSAVPYSGSFSTPGEYTITPTTMSGILDGMMVYIGTGTPIPVIVANPTLTTFDVYWPLSSPPGGSIVSYQIVQTMPTAFSDMDITVDASFDGIASNGYATNDIVHLSVFLGDVTQLTDFRLRVLVGDTLGVNYYEKSILPSSLQPQASTTSTADQSLTSRADQVNLGVVGEFDILNETSNQAKAEELNLQGGSGTGSWSEISVSKNLFLPIGAAGTGKSTWKNVTGFQIFYATTGTASIAIGSLYIAGGFGPNGFSTSQTVPLQPYDYLITYRNQITNQEGPPCVPMISNNYVFPRRQLVALTLVGTADPQIGTASGAQSIAIYRRGGSFSDGLYRRVGYATNPGAAIDGTGNLHPNLITFYDNQSDASLIAADLIEFDNFPPVVASLPTPIQLQWVSWYPAPDGSAWNGAPGQISTFSVVILQAPFLGAINLASVLKRGNQVTIATGTPVQEQAMIEDCIAVGLVAHITVFLQYDHTSTGSNPPSGIGSQVVFVNTASVIGSPAKLACEAYDSIFLAGNAFNPQTLFQSKVGLPESFPIVELDTGISKQIDIGGPSNPIMGVCEFNGQIVTLNQASIYTVLVFGGQMQAAVQTPAQRGCIGTYAWCKADNEIWYMSYDGIYSWSGGQSSKRSQELDPLFKGVPIGNYAPIKFDLIPTFTYTGTDIITFSYYKNKVLITYCDINLQYNRFVYDTIFKRWSIQVIGDIIPGVVSIPAQYTTEDLGDLLISKSFTGGTPVSVSLTASGGVPPYAFSIISGSLPPGLTLNPSTGQITGTPTQTGTFPYTAQVTDSVGTTATSSCSFGVPSLTTTAFLYHDDIGSTDGWVSTPTCVGTLVADGAVINFAVTGNSFTAGEPSLNKQFSEIMVELNNDNGQVIAESYFDYSSTPDSLDSFAINAPLVPAGRRRVPLSLQLGYSKEAYAMIERYHGSSCAPLTLYSTTYNWLPLEQLQSAIAYDWDDLGHPADKRLYEVSLEYDVSTIGGGVVVLNMDTMTGIVGSQTINTAAQTFTLIPAAGTYIGPRRVRTTFPITDGTIVKQVRIRPSPGSSYFKDWTYSFQFEKYPPDIVPFTEWSTYGYNYLKYAQQIVLDIDTGGVNCSVAIYADGGGSPVQTVVANTTSSQRSAIFTLLPNLTGYMFRLVLFNGMGGKAQLFNHHIVFEKADPGEVHHTFDYDMLGWPYDKKLQELTIHYNTTGTSTTILADTITGIKGETINVAALSFVLDGAGRSLQTFAIPDNNYVKMIRLYPQTDTIVFKEWKYEFKFEKMPPDIILFTEWSDFGYPCEKIARNLILELNTDGVNCSVALMTDGSTVQTFTVNTMINARSVVFPCNSNLIGRLWKLELTPGTNGASQLFSWKLDYIREPCAVNYMDTYEQDLGAPGWKWIKQVWVSYVCPSTITMTIFNDNGTFLATTLPAQSTRSLNRFYLPAINAGVLNKTKKVRVQMSSTSPFKLYADSGFEWFLVGVEQRQAYRFLPETPEMQLPVAQLNAAGGRIDK